MAGRPHTPYHPNFQSCTLRAAEARGVSLTRCASRVWVRPAPARHPYPKVRPASDRVPRTGQTRPAHPFGVPRGPGATQPVRAYCHFADPPVRVRAAGRCSAVLNPIGATRVREASFWLGASRIAEDGGCGRPLAATSRVMVRERAPPLRRLVRKVGLASPPRSDHRVRGRPCSA